MRAIRIHEFGIPEVMKYKEVDNPEPGAGQVLVRVHAAGVNPVDTYIRSGLYAIKPDLPYTPGTDAGGVVEAVGTGVTVLKPGDRVYTSGSITGTYAELALCMDTDVYLIPENVSFVQAASIGIPYATAYRALFHKAHARSGETVLVHGGTGGVGIASVQLARHAGLTVIATGGTDKGRALLGEQGASFVFNHRETSYIKKIKEITENRGVDIVLEMLANINLANDLTLIAPKGRIIVIGNRGTVSIDPRMLMMTDCTVTGMMLRNATHADLMAIHSALTEGLAEGTLVPVIGKEIPLVEAPQAHRSVMEPGAYGKIVLVP